jgi:hypothetical protein
VSHVRLTRDLVRAFRQHAGLRLLGVVVLTAAIAVPAEAASGLGWTQLSHVAPGTTDASLVDISCATPDFCVSVGRSRGRMFTDFWNGNSWTVRRLGLPRGAVKSTLSIGDVLCRSANVCVAVGYYDDRAGESHALAELWNGHAWTPQPVVNPPIQNDGSCTGACTVGTGLRQVACPTASECIATGFHGNTSGTGLPITETLSDGQWSLQAAPTPEVTTLSCPALSACFALVQGSRQPLVRWNGTAWTAVPGTIPRSDSLTGLSCSSNTACMAVGVDERKVRLLKGCNGGCTSAEGPTFPVTARWSGTRWDVGDLALPQGADLDPDGSEVGGQADAVACATSSDCTLVGDYLIGPDDSPDAISTGWLSAHWNGRHWMLQRTPQPDDVFQDQLEAISCPSRGVCIAVGAQIQQAAESSPVNENGPLAGRLTLQRG